MKLQNRIFLIFVSLALCNSISAQNENIEAREILQYFTSGTQGNIAVSENGVQRVLTGSFDLIELYEESGNGWNLAFSSSTILSLGYGLEVDIDPNGDRFVFGRACAECPDTDTKAIEVYDLVGTNWINTATLIPSLDIRFFDIEIDGNRIVVGGDDLDYIFIFDWNGSTWVETIIQKEPAFIFRDDIHLDGNRMVLRGGSFLLPNTLLIYDFDGVNWILTKVPAPEKFSSIALDGNKILTRAEVISPATTNILRLYEFDGVNWVNTEVFNDLDPGVIYDNAMDIKGECILITLERNSPIKLDFLLYIWNGVGWERHDFRIDSNSSTSNRTSVAIGNNDFFVTDGLYDPRNIFFDDHSSLINNCSNSNACPPYLTINNNHVGANVLFEACSTILSREVISNSPQIDYSSGYLIELTNGFSIDQNSNLHAFILGCQ